MTVRITDNSQVDENTIFEDQPMKYNYPPLER